MELMQEQKESALDAETMMEMAGPASAVVKTFNKKLVENCTNYQKEWLGFLSLRWHENVSLGMRLMTARTVFDIQQAYVDYWNHTMEQYRTEFCHLEEMNRSKDCTWHTADKAGMASSAKH